MGNKKSKQPLAVADEEVIGSSGAEKADEIRSQYKAPAGTGVSVTMTFSGEARGFSQDLKDFLQKYEAAVVADPNSSAAEPNDDLSLADFKAWCADFDQRLAATAAQSEATQALLAEFKKELS